jgi:hypothetical protein
MKIETFPRKKGPKGRQGEGDGGRKRAEGLPSKKKYKHMDT